MSESTLMQQNGPPVALPMRSRIGTERIEDCKDPDVLLGWVKHLWAQLDAIDTLDDACRENDASFRKLARARQKRRWETGITTDGYELFWEPADHA